MSQFHPLVIKDIRRETADCISVAFDVPEHLEEKFRFQAGQNVTVRLHVDGQELRRSYSICSSPLDNELRIAIKKVDNGRFSSHANEQLRKGDRIDVLPPSGKFNHHPPGKANSRYLAFAAGSGITPIISIIRTAMATDPDSAFTLVYGNRSKDSIIFKEQIDALKNKYMDRFVAHHVFSRQPTDAPVNHGRIDAALCERLSPWLFDPHLIDHTFICGPRELIFSVRDWLEEKGVDRKKIHFELFNVPGQEKAVASRLAQAAPIQSSEVSVKIDGTVMEFAFPFDGSSILDAALKQGADLPFACKGGVCATCRARLLKGQVEMENNYALEREELDNGFILTCQSRPVSSEVFIDFDMK